MREVWEKRWRSVLSDDRPYKEFRGILKAYDKDSVTIEMDDSRKRHLKKVK